MNRALFLVCVVASACGRTTAADLELDPLGAVTVTADAGAQCADEGQACSANGWDFDAPERCCISRMTCFKRASEQRGTCAYSNWCAGEGQRCLANGGDSEVPGHCCNPRHTCRGVCEY